MSLEKFSLSERQLLISRDLTIQNIRKNFPRLGNIEAE